MQKDSEILGADADEIPHRKQRHKSKTKSHPFLAAGSIPPYHPSPFFYAMDREAWPYDVVPPPQHFGVKVDGDVGQPYRDRFAR